MQPVQQHVDGVRSCLTEAGLQMAARSSAGGRERNEDSLSLVPLGAAGVLLAVADGLGGHRGGELASRAFCDAITTLAAQRLSQGGIPREAALTALYEAAGAHLQQMITQSDAIGARTTCALAWIHPQQIVALSVGDTRIYVLRENEIGSWRSRDHSVAELVLYDLPEAGAAGVSEADRSRLYKSLGVKSIPEPALASHPPLQPGDTVVVCSDGVWGCVAIDDLLDLGASADLAAGVDALIERAAFFAGAEADNATLLAARPTPGQAPKTQAVARSPGRQRGSRVTLPHAGTLTVQGVLRNTVDGVTYVAEDSQQGLHWLKEVDLRLPLGQMNGAYLPGQVHLPTGLCRPLELTQTEHSQLVRLEPACTPAHGALGWPASTSAATPPDFPRSAFLALAECHRAKVFHGAIRPRNIAWRPGGHVVFLEPLLRKEAATAHQDVADLLHVCCALEKPGSSRRARLQALARLGPLTAAEVAAQLDGPTPSPGGLRSRLPLWLPAVAIIVAVALAEYAMRPHRREPSSLALPAQVASGQGFLESRRWSPPAPGTAHVRSGIHDPAGVELHLEITAEDSGQPLPASAVQLTIDEQAVDARNAIHLAPKRYTLMVEAPGYEPYSRRLDVGVGDHMEVPIQLRKHVRMPALSQANALRCPIPMWCPPQAVNVSAWPAWRPPGDAAPPVTGQAPQHQQASPVNTGAGMGNLTDHGDFSPPACASTGDCTHSGSEDGTWKPDAGTPDQTPRPATPSSPDR